MIQFLNNLYGTRHLSKRTITADDAHSYLFLLLGAKDQLSKDIFHEFFTQATYELAKKDPTLPTANDLWKQFNNDQDYIVRSQLKSLTRNILQLLADILKKSARIHEYDKFEL